MKQAEESHISLRRLAKLKGGASAGSAGAWQRKLLTMYDSRARLFFKFTRRFTIASDGSCHGRHNTLVSIFFGPVLDSACFGRVQVLWPSKVVAPDEFDVDGDVEQLLAERSAERISSYKLIQVLSSQIHSITQGNLDLEAFHVPKHVHKALAPTSPGMSRRVVNGSFEWLPTLMTWLKTLMFWLQAKTYQL